MKIEEALDQLYQQQMIHACKLLSEKNIKLSSIIMPKSMAEGILMAIVKLNYSARRYELNKGCDIILIAKNEDIFNRLEEINTSPISKEMKDYFYTTVFSVKKS